MKTIIITFTKLLNPQKAFTRLSTLFSDKVKNFNAFLSIFTIENITH
jgi:hypothetical protein